MRDDWRDFQDWVVTHKLECILIMAALVIMIGRPFG